MSASNLPHFIAVGCGGAAGAMLRHAVNQLFIARGWYGIPAATLLVNVAGCLLGGLVLAWLDTKGPSAPLWRSLLLTGFLGGLTTFSALGIELWQFLRAARLDLALWATAAHVGLGVLAVAGGYAAGRAVWPGLSA
jgi:CrcB protein